jgi:DNA invertase Pin-like site-specific DNA recombinase
MELARKRKIDVLLVWRFDRFARSLANLVNSLEELRGLGVDFASYQENIDTTSAQGKMLFGIFASIAEFERALIVDRINAGLRRAKSQGKRFGRPSGILDTSKVMRLRDQKLSLRAIALQVNASKSAVARLLSRNGSQFQAMPSV